MKNPRRNTIRREERQKSAALRQAAREERSDIQQLALLITNGFGHCKEAVRLRARLASV